MIWLVAAALAAPVDRLDVGMHGHEDLEGDALIGPWASASWHVAPGVVGLDAQAQVSWALRPVFDDLDPGVDRTGWNHHVQLHGGLAAVFDPLASHRLVVRTGVMTGPSLYSTGGKLVNSAYDVDQRYHAARFRLDVAWQSDLVVGLTDGFGLVTTWQVPYKPSPVSAVWWWFGFGASFR